MAQAYLTLSEYGNLSLLPSAYASVADGVKTAIIAARSTWADGYLRGQFKLPLLDWEDDLRLVIAQLVDWDVLCRRGFNPEAGTDVAVRKRYEDAVKWLERVSEGDGVMPAVTDSSDGATEGDSAYAPDVISDDVRGWGGRDATTTTEDDSGF